MPSAISTPTSSASVVRRLARGSTSGGTRARVGDGSRATVGGSATTSVGASIGGASAGPGRVWVDAGGEDGRRSCSPAAATKAPSSDAGAEVDSASSACRTASALGQRASASRAIALATTASRAAPTSANADNRGGWDPITWRMQATSSPSNGRRPAIASNSTTPRPYTSDRGLALAPPNTSGARYATLPRSTPVAVRTARFRARAIPKSASFTSPVRDSRTFCGEMSRCTISRGRPEGSVAVWA